MPRNNEEHRIQCGIVQHARARWPVCKRLLFAIPNGGTRDVRTGANLKAEGVTAGVWDLFLAFIKYDNSCDMYDYMSDAGLFIEVKDPKRRNHKNGGLTTEQVAFGEAVRDQGYATAVVYTTQEGLDVIARYLEG